MVSTAPLFEDRLERRSGCGKVIHLSKASCSWKNDTLEMHSYTFHREVSCPRLWLPVLPVLPVPAAGHVAPRGSRSSGTAPDRPEPAVAAEPAVGRVAPRGSRVGFMFSDGRQRTGTVLGLPWPAGHRWQHWRRVRIDGGGVCDVDSMHVAFAARMNPLATTTLAAL